ncbi:unnamed protein product [Closterium sp. NIES-53]
MASLRVLAFGHEGRPLKFDTWLDDLQLYLLSDSRDSVLLFDHKSGAAPTPPATADSATHSQWLTRDAAARLAICNHLPLAECAHFGQHRTAQALYDAVVARYSSPATAALGRLLLPYLCPELSAFATVEDLGPLSLSLDPTVLTLDLLEQHLLAAKTIAVAVGAARGTPRTPFFEGCSPSPLAPSYASAAAIDVLGTEDVRAASASAKCRSSKGKGGRGGGGGSGSGGGGSNGGSGGGGSGGSGGASGGLGGGGGGSGGSGSSGSGGTGGGRTGAQRGDIEAAALGASDSSLPGNAPAEALPTFTLDSGASRSRVSGQGRERYFLLVNDDYTRYTTVFPLRTKGQVVDVLIPWIRAVRLQLRERFHQDLPLLRLHSNRGGEFSSDLLPDLCRGEGILQSFTLPTSPQQNGIAERHIGLVVEPRVSLPKTSPTLRWTGEVGDASVFRVWGSRAFARDMSADKLSARTISCVFVGFPPDAPRWQFYHPTSRCVFPSQDVTFDESVPFYRLFPYRSAPPPPPPLFLAPGPPPVDPLLPQGVASAGAEPGGAESEGAGSGGAESGDAEPGGVEPGVAEPEGVEPEGAESGGAEPQGAASSRDTGARGAGVTVGAGGTGGTGAAGPGGARIGGTEAAETGGVGGAGAEDPTEPGAAGAGGTGAGGTCAGAEGAGAEGTGAGGAVGAGAGGTVRPRLFFVPLLQQVLGDPSSPSLTPPLLCSLTDQSQLPFQPASPLPAPSPYTELSSGLTEHREPASRPVLPVRTARRVPRLRPPHVLGMHNMVLCPSSVPLRVPLPPPESSLPTVPDPESDLVRAASPTVSCILSTVVTDPSFESTTSSALVAELLDFAASCRLEYATALVAESESTSPPSVGGECALCTDVLEDRQEDFECLAAAVPCFASMPLAPEGDPDAPDIPTPRSYAEAITVPPSPANIIDGMWIFRVKRPPGSPPAFKARYVARGFSQRQGVDYFQTFSPTPNMTTLWVLSWPVYGLRLAPRGWHDTLRTTLAALGFAPSTADPLLFLRIDTSPLPLYILVYIDDLVFATAHTEALTLVKSELHKRHTCTDLGELRSYLGLQITRDRARRTITLTQSHMVHQVLQHFGFQFSSPQPTPLSTSHSLSAPPSDESIELSGPYLELVGCLMYVMTCTRPDLAYPLSLLARYVAPSRHRKVHWDAAKRVLRYLCSTSGMGLLLGGRGPVVLTGQADASWVDDSATQRSSQSYNFTLGYGFVSWRSTRSSSVLSSSCEAEIYAGAMAALVLRWLTYLLTDLGEQPRSPPFPYVDNKAMIALCQEHRLEHRMKHIALRYFLARELQQRGQLRLAYVATRANTADIFTKALPPGDHQRFSTMLGLVPTLPHLLTE